MLERFRRRRRERKAQPTRSTADEITKLYAASLHQVAECLFGLPALNVVQLRGCLEPLTAVQMMIERELLRRHSDETVQSGAVTEIAVHTSCMAISEGVRVWNKLDDLQRQRLRKLARDLVDVLDGWDENQRHGG